MKKAKRIQEVMIGILMILLGFLMILLKDNGFVLIMLVLSVWLLAYGIRQLAFYSSMARHMVGGKTILYLGIILFDFGFFTLTLATAYKLYTILYMLVFYAFAGAIDILRSNEMRKNEAPNWKWKMGLGAGEIIIALCSLIFGIVLKYDFMVVYLFSAGLIYTACMRIAGAFRKTEIIYIQ